MEDLSCEQRNYIKGKQIEVLIIIGVKFEDIKKYNLIIHKTNLMKIYKHVYKTNIYMF